MSDFFDSFIRMIEAVGPSPVQYGRGGILAANRVIDRMAPCPQGNDCAGDGKHRRLFKCEECDYVGCAACCDLHEVDPHVTDAINAASGKG